MDFVVESKRLVSALGFQLAPVPKSIIDSLKKEFADLPITYEAFLTQVGAGGCAGKFQIYDGLVDPDEVYDPDTAEALEGVVLFGDDYQGFCVGFTPADGWHAVEIDPTHGEARVIADSFDAFMLERLRQF